MGASQTHRYLGCNCPHNVAAIFFSDAHPHPMCGRYTGTIDPAELAALIPLDACTFDFQPRYNIAPTQIAPVIARQGGRSILKGMRWGLIPSWADDEKIGHKLINARVETAEQKPVFRAAWNSRRCLIPADGFYEWQRREGGKQPWHFHLKDRSQFCFAGLWETWVRPPSAQGDFFENELFDPTPLETFTILTTAPNNVMARFHDRMPLMFSKNAAPQWLDMESPAIPSEIGADEIGFAPANPCVNSPAFDKAECLVAPAND